MLRLSRAPNNTTQFPHFIIRVLLPSGAAALHAPASRTYTRQRITAGPATRRARRAPPVARVSWEKHCVLSVSHIVYKSGEPDARAEGTNPEEAPLIAEGADA